MAQTNEIEQGNKLIAEFLGWTIEKGMENEKNPFYNQPYRPGFMPYMLLLSDLRFHSSWDWLHPVYRKIGEIGLWMMTNGHDKLWLEKSQRIDYAMLHQDTPEAAAKLIAQLIKWYNTQTPK